MNIWQSIKYRFMFGQFRKKKPPHTDIVARKKKSVDGFITGDPQ